MRDATRANQRLWRFLAPDPTSFVSGGNVYNLRLLENAGCLALTPPETFDALGSAPILCDSLALRLGAELSLEAPKVLLVHYLESFGAPAKAQEDAELLKAFDAFVATSSFTHAKLEALGVADKPILVLPPGLSFEPRSRERRARVMDGLTCLMVANWLPGKGVLELLEALAERLSGEERFTLEIAGDTRIDPFHSRDVERLLERQPRLARKVRPLGALDPDGLRAAYLAADCLVSAARLETFGMAIQDALAVGLPVLARRGGYVEALLAKGGGEIFPDVASLAERILALARDPAQIEHLARAPATRPSSSWQEIGARLSRFLRDLEK